MQQAPLGVPQTFQDRHLHTPAPVLSQLAALLRLGSSSLLKVRASGKASCNVIPCLDPGGPLAQG